MTYILYIYISFWIYKRKSKTKCDFSFFWKKKKGLTQKQLQYLLDTNPDPEITKFWNEQQNEINVMYKKIKYNERGISLVDLILSAILIGGIMFIGNYFLNPPKETAELNNTNRISNTISETIPGSNITSNTNEYSFLKRNQNFTLLYSID